VICARGHILLRLIRAGVAIMLVAPVLACSTSEKKMAGLLPQDTVDPVSKADLSPRFPTGPAADERYSNPEPNAQPILFPGSQADPVAPPVYRDVNGEQRVASADDGAVVQGDGVEVNFENADVPAVAKTLLGDVLKMNYVVDPRVQGSVTLSSVGPIPRKDVLPAFESVLRMSNAAIVRDGNLVKIVPVQDAAGRVNVGAGQSGFGVSIVPLHYTSATTVARAAENFVTRAGAIRVDQSRNLVLVQGTTNERETAIDVISSFDVEWLHSQSVGVYPLKATTPETMIQELDRVFQTVDNGEGQGVITFQPISRMNAVMAVTRNPKFLEQTTTWIRRLDRADRSGTTVRIFRLKFASAPRLAKILSDMFTGKGGLSTADTPAGQVAPGAQAAKSRIDSLDRGGSNGSGTTTQASGSIGGTGGQGGGAAGTIQTAFESFSKGNSNGSGNDPNGSGAGASGGDSHGVFQNVRITADVGDNSIMVYSDQEEYRVIENTIREMDRPQLQVEIDATVAEVTLTDNLQYGVQSFLTSSDVGAAADKGSVGFMNGPTQSAIQGALLSRVVPGYNLVLGPEAQPRFILNALSSITNVKVLSAPTLVVKDSEPALLEVGNEIPISTGSATILSSSTTPIVNTIEMRNTGVILKVLPHVHANGSIEMEVEQEISNVVNQAGQTTPTLTPTISERRVHSTVVVNSEQTVLLGGMISENVENDKSGIPGLNQIKFIGDILGSTNGTKTRTEIIIFIKPRLIRNAVDARNAAEEFRERLQSMHPNTGVKPVGDPPGALTVLK